MRKDEDGDLVVECEFIGDKAQMSIGFNPSGKLFLTIDSKDPEVEYKFYTQFRLEDECQKQLVQLLKDCAAKKEWYTTQRKSSQGLPLGFSWESRRSVK